LKLRPDLLLETDRHRHGTETDAASLTAAQPLARAECDRQAANTCAFTTPDHSEVHMKRVTGIGGIFFKAKDAPALQAWYQRHLGIAARRSGP